MAVLPEDGAAHRPLRPLFAWTQAVPTPGALDERATTEIDRYRIHVSTDQTFTDLAALRDLEIDQWLSADSVDALLADTAYFPANIGGALLNDATVDVKAVFLTEELGEKLAAGERYYWRLRSEKGDGSWKESPWANGGSFVTDSLKLTRYYYFTDHLGSIRATVNDSGQVVHYDDYFPFGSQMPRRSMDADGPKERFTGHELDDETELLYAGARYLDPVVGRWYSVDPMGDSYPGWSGYHYTYDNPLRWFDPYGMFANDATGALLWHYDEKGNLVADQGDNYDTLRSFFGDDRFLADDIWEYLERKGEVNEDGTVNEGSLVERDYITNSIHAEGFLFAATTVIGDWLAQKVLARAGGWIAATLEKSAFSDDILEGISRNINLGRQGKHILGHNNYIQGRSVLKGNPQALLDEIFSGSVKSIQKINQTKVRVDFGKIIGNYVDPASGVSIPTTRRYRCKQ